MGLGLTLESQIFFVSPKFGFKRLLFPFKTWWIFVNIYPWWVCASCRVHKGTGLDDNNRNLESFPIHCNVHDNPLIEPGEMQYYAKIEGTDRFTNHDSLSWSQRDLHPWVNSILDANNIPSLKSVSYTPHPKPINTPQCNCSLTQT